MKEKDKMKATPISLFQKRNGSKKTCLLSKSTVWMCLIVILFSILHSCTSMPEPTPLVFSGFLENYSGLRPSPDGTGAWSYKKPGMNLKPYSKVMIDPLVIWPSLNSSYKGINTIAMWQLALAFHERMVTALQDGYTIVQEPGPGVIRLRAAVTEVLLIRPGITAPGPLLPLASDVALLSSETISGFSALSGQAAIEAELLDSQTHERLVAYVEKRTSGEVLITKDAQSLTPITRIFKYWAKKLRQRLDEERGLKDYQKVIR